MRVIVTSIAAKVMKIEISVGDENTEKESRQAEADEACSELQRHRGALSVICLTIGGNIAYGGITGDIAAWRLMPIISRSIPELPTGIVSVRRRACIRYNIRNGCGRSSRAVRYTADGLHGDHHTERSHNEAGEGGSVQA